jgi:hypothetical protein
MQNQSTNLTQQDRDRAAGNMYNVVNPPKMILEQIPAMMGEAILTEVRNPSYAYDPSLNIRGFSGIGMDEQSMLWQPNIYMMRQWRDQAERGPEFKQHSLEVGGRMKTQTSYHGRNAGNVVPYVVSDVQQITTSPVQQVQAVIDNP